MAGRCKIIQHYAGGVAEAYWTPDVDVLIVDTVQREAFSHVPRDKMVTRNQCCDIDFFKPIVSDYKFDCIMAGGFYASKGQDIIVDIFKDTPISVLFAGAQKSNTGETTQEFINTINYYNGLKNKKLSACFQDFVHPSKMPDIYNSANVFVWGSRWSIENPITLTNRSVVEAVACGLPFVAFRQTFQNSNFVKDGVNAILVDNDNDFWRSVITLVEDDSFRLKYSQASRQIAIEELDFKKWHDQFYMDLYGSILR
ncbi:MAG: glycosyltransferase [Nitrospirae bacterium]|nr:glycosyltransferase [Nitrospirota bacterium]